MFVAAKTAADVLAEWLVGGVGTSCDDADICRRVVGSEPIPAVVAAVNPQGAGGKPRCHGPLSLSWDSSVAVDSSI